MSTACLIISRNSAATPSPSLRVNFLYSVVDLCRASCGSNAEDSKIITVKNVYPLMVEF